MRKLLGRQKRYNGKKFPPENPNILWVNPPVLLLLKSFAFSKPRSTALAALAAHAAAHCEKDLELRRRGLLCKGGSSSLGSAGCEMIDRFLLGAKKKVILTCDMRF